MRGLRASQDASPVGTHAWVPLVLDSARSGPDLVGDEPAAVLLVEVQRPVPVLVHRVARALAVQEVRAETLGLIPQGLLIRCLQRYFFAIAQTS